MAATTSQTPTLHNRTYPKSSPSYQNPITNIKTLLLQSAKRRRTLPLVASLHQDNTDGSRGQNWNAIELRKVLEDLPNEINSKDSTTLPSHDPIYPFNFLLYPWFNFDVLFCFVGFDGKFWFLKFRAFDFGTFVEYHL